MSREDFLMIPQMTADFGQVAVICVHLRINALTAGNRRRDDLEDLLAAVSPGKT